MLIAHSLCASPSKAIMSLIINSINLSSLMQLKLKEVSVFQQCLPSPCVICFPLPFVSCSLPCLRMCLGMALHPQAAANLPAHLQPSYIPVSEKEEENQERETSKALQEFGKTVYGVKGEINGN